jgi:hypothetical protein
MAGRGLENEDAKSFFRGLLEPSRWKTFEEYAAVADAQLEKDLAHAERRKQSITQSVRKELERDFDIKTQDDDRLEAARETLYKGHACAVDGTHSIYQLITGIRAQIGVAATSYLNNQIEHAIYVYEPEMEVDEAEIAEIVRNRSPEERMLTPLVVRAVMSFTERRIALERDEEWKFIQGSLVPYELRVGGGKFRTLVPCLEIATQIIRCERAMGVIGRTTRDDLMTLALALRDGEYVKIKTLRDDIDDYLKNAHFNPEDEDFVRGFSEREASKIWLGAYRVGPKAYLFEAHERTFDESAHMIMADAMHQRMRGFPLLIDYADSICSRMLSASDFENRITHKLSKLGSWAEETNERATRRR